MKTTLLSILAVGLSLNLMAQGAGKDTVKPDSTQLEKIKKMPMDTIHHKTPVKPVPQEKKKEGGKDESPILTPSGRKDQ
jgi:hypothetical protein